MILSFANWCKEFSLELKSIKTKKILEGVRGEKPSDIKKLSECIQRLSQLVSDFHEIKEFFSFN